MLGDELRTIAKTRNAAETTSQKTSRKSKWLNIKVPTQDGRKKSEKKAQQIEKSRDHHANCLRNKSSLTAKKHAPTNNTQPQRSGATKKHKHTNTLKQCSLVFTREEPPKGNVARGNVERVKRRKAFVEEEQHEEDDDGKAAKDER